MTQREMFQLRLYLEGDRVVDERGRVYDVDEAIKALPWRWVIPGGGMPDHAYVVFRKSPRIAWDVLSTIVRDHATSYKGYFRGYPTPNLYWEHEGWRYWRTGGGTGAMMNRCTFDSVEPPRRVDQGAVPLSWGDGPPWAPLGHPWPPGYFRDRFGKMQYDRERDPRMDYPCAKCGKRYWLHTGDRPCVRCGHIPRPDDPEATRRGIIDWR